jgi:putative intracellular protease/amidase
MVLSSHALLGSSGAATGFWWEEFAEPWRVFTDAGLFVDLASPQGGRPPVDPASVDVTSSLDARLDALLADTVPLASVEAAHYAAVFLVGGHGTMWDFPEDRHLAGLVGEVYRSGVVTAVCHGVAGLLGAVTDDNRPIVAGRTVTAFSDAEEVLVGADTVIPFSLQQRLVGSGAVVEVGAAFSPQVRRDGRLVTGQNPASSAAAAMQTVDALAATRSG